MRKSGGSSHFTQFAKSTTITLETLYSSGLCEESGSSGSRNETLE